MSISRIEAGDGARRRAVAIMKLLALAAFLLHLALVFRDGSSFLSRPFQEDAFYSLSVAKSIGQGEGITIDGVHPTNGVQPLICFLDAPFFTIGGGDQALTLRLVMLLQVIIFTGASLAIAWFASSLLRAEGWRRELFWFTTMIVAWSYMLANGMLNGLETGLAAGLVFASAAYYNRKIAAAEDAGLGRFLLLGLMLGVAVLARIDIAFLVAALIGWHLLRAHLLHRSRPMPERMRRLGRVLGECFAMGGMSVLVSAPWWIYNQTTFGSLLPISGQAQQMLIPDRWLNIRAAIATISDSFLVLFHTPQEYTVYSLSPFIGVAAFAVIMLLFLLATSGFTAMRRVLGEWRGRWNLSGAVPLLIFCGMLLVYYIFFFGAPHFIVRYLVPLRTLIVVAVSGTLFLLWKETAPASKVHRGLVALLLLGMGVSAYGHWWNFSDHFGNIYLHPARWIAEHRRPGEKVGMFQSGTTGFLDRSVVNLDGKVNADALRALEKGRIPAYVDSMRFAYLIDWDYFLSQALADPAVRAHYTPVDTLEADFIVWKRVVP